MDELGLLPYGRSDQFILNCLLEHIAGQPGLALEKTAFVPTGADQFMSMA